MYRRTQITKKLFIESQNERPHLISPDFYVFISAHAYTAMSSVLVTWFQMVQG